MNDTIEHVWRTYHDGLRGFILSRVNDRDIADDILQDVFVKVQSGIGALADGSKIKSWTYQIARNTIIDHYRRHRQLEALPDELAAPESDITEQARREIESCLLPLIRNLPDPYRRAIEMSEIDGLTQQQVANELNVSLSGAKSRVQRGRRMIKDTLLACCRFEFDHRMTMVDYEAKEAGCEACR
jgi:RNA polymerase sigma-70 factor (ECF subfamily)